MEHPPGFLGQVRLSQAQVAPDQASLPKPSEVLYRKPNPDGSRKRCSNCVLWISSRNLCSIHANTVEVLDRYFCGFHVYGTPYAQEPAAPPEFQPVEPQLSGLRIAGGGLSCDNCVHYREDGSPSRGHCVAVADPGTGKPPTPVDSKGICARQRAI